MDGLWGFSPPKRLNDLNPNLFAKTKPGKGGKKDTEELKEVASMEAQVYRFAEMSNEEEEEEPDDDIPYNPKNLPLGWDGKPIPYWLYKLHGLNLICDNFPYKGPKAFQKHFAEWRHAHGMRCRPHENFERFEDCCNLLYFVEYNSFCNWS